MAMNWAAIFLVAVLVVLLVLIIYVVVENPTWAQKDYWMAHLVETPWEVLRRSGGTFDDAAQLALERATARDNPTPDERLLAATVIRQNVLGQEHRAARDVRGAPARAALQHTRERVNLFGQARDHYMAALQGVGGRPQAAAGGHGAGFILDAVAGFAFGGFTELMENDPLLAEMLLGDEDDWAGAFFGFQMFGAGGVDAPLATAAAQHREDVTRRRQEEADRAAAEQDGARGAAVDTYVDLAMQHTNDPQNAHDKGVLTCLKAIIGRLRADQAGQRLVSPDEVIEEIKKLGSTLSEGRPHRVADAVAVAERTKTEERVVAIGATDGECLGRVWMRASDPRNVAVRGQIRQAVFDALVDAWEDGFSGRKIVCVNGRTTRILSSLVLLDWDERNWHVKKLEQFKNDIYERAREVIAEEAERASRSHDDGKRKAGRLYLARTAAEVAAAGDAPDDAVAALEDAMRVAISAMVDDYVATISQELGTDEPIPPHIVESTRMEAMAAVG
jgi:hypothetical protein